MRVDEANKNKTILIIEDNPVNMKLVRDLLQHFKFTVIECYNGREALDVITANKDILNLILVDLKLPEVDGVTIIKYIREDPTTHKIPVIVLSAQALDIDIQKATKAGCNCYITKPINVKDFLAKVDMFIQ